MSIDDANSDQCDQPLMPWSHQTVSAFHVGEIVSCIGFHDGPSPSNLYNNAEDGDNLHYDVHVWMRVKCVGPTTKNLWYVHTAQLVACPRAIK